MQDARYTIYGREVFWGQLMSNKTSVMGSVEAQEKFAIAENFSV